MNQPTLDTNQSGVSHPDVIDGTPESSNDREAMRLASQSLNDDYEGGDDDDGDDEENETSGEKFKAIPAAKPGKKLNADINSAVEKIIQLKADRTIINSKIKEIVEGLEAKGILRDALNDTMKKMEWTEAKRESYLLGCKLSGSALGIMEQADLFVVN